MAAAPKNIRDYKLCLSLKKDLAYQILAGSKTYESRIATSSGTKLMNLQVGDVLAFHWYTNERVTAKILQIPEVFESLSQMLQRIPLGQLIPGAPVTSLDDATKQYEKVLGFKALQNKVIVFKIGEPVYHSGVAPKTESKSKKKKRVLAEMDKLAEAVASMDSSKKPRVDQK